MLTSTFPFSETDADEEAAYPERFATRELVDYILRRHHDPLREVLPALRALAHDVARELGPQRAERQQLVALLDEACDVILGHLDEEERDVFPVLLGARRPPPGFGRVLAAMREEGYTVLHLVRRMQHATHGFRVPPDASRAHRTLVTHLSALGPALVVHATLELDVLLVRFGKSLG